MTSLDLNTSGKWFSRAPIVMLRYRKPSEGVPEVVSALRVETGMGGTIFDHKLFRRVAVLV